MQVGIAGSGGIGSNVAYNLVKSGIKDIILVDFDILEFSNLNRQFYFKDQIGEYKVNLLKKNLDRIYDDLNIKTFNLKLDKKDCLKIFKNCDVIIEAFDKSEYKKNIMEVFGNSSKLLVSASGIAGKNIENIRIKKLGKNSFIIGDFLNDVKDNPIYFPKINIIASMMADIALKFTERNQYE
ncbi:MAG: sulfur carrier protein ThiS adenylyltransferase ThiF [Fusobacteriota bacterium]